MALKLENLQVSGSFKARGASNALASLPAATLDRGVVTASGGNHGLGVAQAAWRAGVPATIYLGRNAPPVKAERLALWGATVVTEGAGWDEANAAALARAEADDLAYVHPFADPAVIAGQGTVALEILDDAPETEVILVPIGGGGLIAGVAAAAKARKPPTRIIGVEPEGAPTLKNSRAAGRVIALDGVATEANTLAPRRSAQINLDLIAAHVDDIVLVSDEAMRAAARWLWLEMGVAAELAGAATSAALIAGAYRPLGGEAVCAVVSGTGTAGMN